MPFHQGQSVFNYALRVAIENPDDDAGLYRILVAGWTLGTKEIARANATHLRWTVVAAPIPYCPHNPVRNRVLQSPWFEIDTNNPNHSQPWSCIFDPKDLNADGKEIIIALAFETAQKTNDAYYPLATNKAMSILKIHPTAPE
jgi:hypothetical protein